MPGVSVTLRNTENNLTYETQADQSGEFRFLTVPAGQYELIAKKAGFAKIVHSVFAVHAAEPARVDFALKVGNVTEELTVSGAPPVVNTVTANEGNTITGQQVNSLPLTNRVFTQLMSLEPGVSMPVVVDPGFGSNSSVNFSVNGVRDDENNLLIDGVRNADTFGGNAFVTPNLFAVSEVRIENNDYTATAGRSAGAQVNLVTRSGTNQFHGDAFEFFRNNAFNAENLFSTSSPEDRHNDFGYDVGGPIKKDRLFFFWSEQWRRIVVNSGPVITVTPTTLERQGNFSQSLIQPIDPTTGLPFPNNTIPQGRLDQNAQLLLATYFPQPTPNYNLDDLYNFISQAPNYTRWREELARIDVKLNDKWNLFGRYTQDTNLLNNPYGLFGENSFPYVGGSTQNFPMYNLSLIHILIVAVSQSGQSAEVVRMLEINRGKSSVIAITNTPGSPLAERADATILSQAGQEFSVSCKTYLTGLMALRWLGDVLCERDLRRTGQELKVASPAVLDYLAHWKEHVQSLAQMLKSTRHLFLVGRGSSLAAVGTGALIVKESDHFHAEGMSSAAFRHGPFEMLSDETFVLVFAGERKTRDLNQSLFEDVREEQGRAELIGEGAAFPPCALPSAPRSIHPILEILPVQMVTLALAAQVGREPGRFELASKVTTKE